MMNCPHISVLSPLLANQIAAGEVIERPASVFKELVENSIDAGATSIQVEVTDGGNKRIMVRDNGCGITKDQLGLALQRHATSKIQSLVDLEHILTKGFRGEALASVASVSRLTLSSKPEGQAQAWRVRVEGTDMDPIIEPTAHPLGTSVEVLDLFFNTPARKKFLKSAKTEYHYLQQAFYRIALAHPNIEFSLRHNQKSPIRMVECGQHPQRRINAVIGNKYGDTLVYAEREYQQLKCHGWFSPVGISQPYREHQYSYVNRRPMRDKLIQHAVATAYEGLVPPGGQPVYALFIELPSDLVDVNVHPAKQEVRFVDSKAVHDLIYQLITTELQVTASAKPLHHYQPPSLDSGQTPATTRAHPAGISSFGSARYASASSPSSSVIKSARDLWRTALPQHHSVSETLSPTSALETVPAFIFADGKARQSIMIETDGQAQTWSTADILRRYLRSLRASGVLQVMQPLLIPISCVVVSNRCDGGLHSVPIELDDWRPIQDQALLLGVKLDYQGQKVILKQVNPVLRQLPWSEVLANLEWPMIAAGELCFEKSLSQVWAQQSPPSRTDMEAILQALDLGNIDD